MRLALSRSRRRLLVVVVSGLTWISLTGGVSSARSPALTYDPELVLSAKYEERVRFWIDVFTRYRLDEAIVHDRSRPEHVLAVVPLETGSRAELNEIQERYRKLIGALGRAAPGERSRFLQLFQAPIDPRWITAAQDRLRVQQGQREVFANGLVRSRLLLEMVRGQLREMGIPEMVAYLPHVESSFDADAVSPAGALGLWQLMPETARRYLRVDEVVDERLQPTKATRAAATYLRMAHELLGSWPLAITAYNYGVNGMRRAVAALGTNDLAAVIERHDSPVFGFAGRNFYLQFLAATHVAMNQQHYFPELGRWQVYVVREGDTLWQIARRHGTTIEALRSENREALAESRYLRLGQRLVISG
jgi:membrane-bound lytic murein transglycosylase D